MPRNDNKKSTIPLLVLFIVMLGAIITITYFASSPIPIIMGIVCVSILFALLLNETISSVWTRELEVVFFKIFNIKIFRQEKLHEINPYTTPLNDRPQTSITTNESLDNGRKLFKMGNYQKARSEYKKIGKADSAYWYSRVSVLLCLVKLQQYVEAETEAKYIQDKCKNGRYVAQSLINISEYYMRLAETSQEHQKKALANYLRAYELDPEAITSLYYCWVAKMENGEDTEVIAHLITQHKDFQTLSQDFIEYFERHNEKINKSTSENFIINWKKIILSCIVLGILSLSTFAGGVLN